MNITTFQTIDINNPLYPSQIKERIPNPPTTLWFHGNTDILSLPSVAVIGAREATPQALKWTIQITEQQVQKGNAIVSGFAIGTDRIAHAVAMDNNGYTLLVIPTGINKFTFEEMWLEYIINGRLAILSVFSPDTPFETSHAHARNSIIYALANQIFISETSTYNKGGTWNSAVKALKGRQINGKNKSRKGDIFIMKPDPKIRNYNEKLVEIGAIPI